MTLAYLEKMTNRAGTITYTWQLHNYQWDSPGSDLATSFGPLSSGDFAFDMLGDRPAPRGNAMESLKLWSVHATAALAEAEMRTMRSTLWRIGRGKLYVLTDDGSRLFSYGRLAHDVGFSRTMDQFVHFGADAQFIRSSDWMATTATAPAATTVTTSPVSITVNNPGNYPVKGACGLVIRIRANTSSGWSSSVLIENLTTGESITLSGAAVTCASTNDEIKIDCSAKTILKSIDDGVSYPTSLWPSATLGDQNGFFSPDPGDNTFRITTGGTPRYDFSYSFNAPY